MGHSCCAPTLSIDISKDWTSDSSGVGTIPLLFISFIQWIVNGSRQAIGGPEQAPDEGKVHLTKPPYLQLMADHWVSCKWVWGRGETRNSEGRDKFVS